MKALILFFNLIFISLVAQSQSDLIFHSTVEEETINNFITNGEEETTHLQLIADANLTFDQLTAHDELVQKWVEYFREKKVKMRSDRQFISHLFYKVHRKLLKNYVPFTTFNQTLSNGDYDCLSGTTLYATLLSQLNIPFEVIETNYHIYIKVQVEDNQIVLLESTDPLAGFIENSDEIADRLEEYKAGNSQTASASGEYTYQVSTNKAIDLVDLVGLQYYNTAVNAFNSGQLSEAIVLFQKAGIFYNSPRFKEFGYVLAHALIADENMSTSNKRLYLKRIPLVDAEAVVSAF